MKKYIFSLAIIWASCPPSLFSLDSPEKEPMRNAMKQALKSHSDARLKDLEALVSTLKLHLDSRDAPKTATPSRASSADNSPRSNETSLVFGFIVNDESNHQEQE